LSSVFYRDALLDRACRVGFAYSQYGFRLRQKPSSLRRTNKYALAAASTPLSAFDRIHEPRYLAPRFTNTVTFEHRCIHAGFVPLPATYSPSTPQSRALPARRPAALGVWPYSWTQVPWPGYP